VAPGLTFRRALLGTIALALLAGLVPASVILDRQLAGALEERARSDLALAPAVFGDRQLSAADAMMMHAKEFAHSPALAAALARGDRDGVRRVAEDARAALGGEPLVVGADGTVWTGPTSARSVAGLLPRIRRGEMPVLTVRDSARLNEIALAPVEHEGRLAGAAGLVTKLDEQRTGAIGGLTRADVIVVAADSSQGAPTVAASTLDSATTRLIALAMPRWVTPDSAATQAPGTTPRPSSVHDISIGDRRFIAATASLGSAGHLVLVRDLGAELAVVPRLRRIALWSALAALASALVLGFALATRIARPVSDLAGAAAALARGDFAAPVPDASAVGVREVSHLAAAFGSMRAALAERIAELHEANDALADRNARLTALQADLVQRERLVATGRLVTHLAHEIRNPVASLRNCLELIRRRLAADAEGLEFADLAIDELLRMHELAEQMLDVNRPRDASAARCRPADVARDVATLLSAGASADSAPVTWILGEGATGNEVAAISADVLKQVVLNLAQNGRDAIGVRREDADAGAPPGVHLVVRAADASVRVDVRDDGPGIAPELVPRIFDPFFTTKPETRGVGLGLSIAEGLVRSVGGRLTLSSPGGAGRGGAVFEVELPRVAPDAETGGEPGSRRDDARAAMPRMGRRSGVA
jgi:two-component system NtrC family sensor kinase